MHRSTGFFGTTQGSIMEGRLDNFMGTFVVNNTLVDDYYGLPFSIDSFQKVSWSFIQQS